MLVGCALIVSSEADYPRDTLPAEVYNGFLRHGNQDVFGAFEQDPVFQTFPPQKLQICLNESVLIYGELELKPEYFAFGRSGTNFILAFSEDLPVLSRADLMTAEELNGLNGEGYWFLSLNSPIEIRRKVNGGEAPLPQPLSLNRPSIVPIEEFRGHANCSFQGIRPLHARCLSVLQVGYDKELPGASGIPGSTVVLKGRNGDTPMVRAEGDLRKPNTSSYQDLLGAMVVAPLSYKTDTLTVSRLIKEKVRSQMRYRILAFEAPFEPQARFLSTWQTYKALTGNVLGALIKNVAKVKPKFTDSSTFQLGGVLPTTTLLLNAQGSGVSSICLSRQLTLASLLLCTDLIQKQKT